MIKTKWTWFAGLALAALAAGGCAALKSPESQAALQAETQKFVGTAGLSERVGALEERADGMEERQKLSYAFTWLTAEKNGISETDARDWLAGRTSPSGGDGETVPADVDAVDFSRLQWEFGGVDGSRAALSSPRLSGLHAGASSISYKWETGLSGWGLSNGDAGALACFFVERKDGSIVGGKFDWVSTSRSSRPLKNVLEGYVGWSLDGVSNPAKCWFVVISENGKLRSNVIGAEWQR